MYDRKKLLAEFLREWIRVGEIGAVCIVRLTDQDFKATLRVNCLLRTLKFLFCMSAAKYLSRDENISFEFLGLNSI